MRWFLPLALLGLSAAHADEPRRYAVVVGANEGGSNDGLLRYAERDADRVASVLRQLGGVLEEDLITLHSPTPARVHRVLAEIAERAEGAVDGSVLTVYYSGHADSSSMHLGRDTLPFDELVAAVDAVPVDVRLLVVDACNSGSLTRSKGGSPAEPFELRLPPPTRAEGTAIITSSSETEDSQESDYLRGGVFTHHFVTGLLGAADASGDRQVTLQEAYRYGYDETIRTTSRARFVQHPTYALELRGEDDLVLTRLDGGRRTGDVVVAEPADYVFFESDAQGTLVAEAHLESGGVLALASGEYWVRSRSPQGVREGAVSVPTGVSVPLAQSHLQPVTLGRALRKGYDDSQRAHIGIATGLGLSGPARPKLGLSPGAYLGLRIDGAQLSGLVRVRYARSQSRNTDLMLTEHVAGADLTALRLFDVGPVSPGIGLRGGADVVVQNFETNGVAEPRQAMVGRVGSVIRTEFGAGARHLFAVEGSLDVVMQRTQTSSDVGTLSSDVVPGIALEWTFYAR